jgi:hypothetical protein
MSNNERSEKLANVVSPKTVTAQDFKKLFSIKHALGGHMLVYDLKKVDALLSRARQEERHEYAKEVRGFMNDSLEVAKESLIQQERQEARREALKEMDAVHEDIVRQIFVAGVAFKNKIPEFTEATDKLIKLRAEYNQP